MSRGRPKPRRRMYTPEQQMAYVPCPCDPKMIPFDNDLVDKTPETGICPDCHLKIPTALKQCPDCT